MPKIAPVSQHEHTFAGWHLERCEATMEETLGKGDKKGHKIDAIYNTGLAVH